MLKNEVVVDGKKFSSKAEAMRYYGASVSTVHARMTRKGMTFEQAVLGKNMRGAGKKVYDHYGIEYPSIKKMEEAYGLPSGMLRRRLVHGMSLRQALELPADYKEAKKGHVIQEGDKIYPSVAEYCRAKGISSPSAYERIAATA